MARVTEGEIVRRVITDCVEPGMIECRLWRCQNANRCQKHDYKRSLGQIMDALETDAGEIQ